MGYFSWVGYYRCIGWFKTFHGGMQWVGEDLFVYMIGFRVECGIAFNDGLFVVDMSLFGYDGLSFSLFCDTGHDFFTKHW